MTSEPALQQHGISTESTGGFDFSLETAVQYASLFLTVCLTDSHPMETVEKIRSILEYNLYQHCAPFWDPKRPKRGSLRRSLTFNLSLSTGFSLPPSPIYSTCVTADIQWFEWTDFLGNVDFDFFIDPGCVSFRREIDGKPVVLWAADWGPDELESDGEYNETQEVDMGLEVPQLGLYEGLKIPYWVKEIVRVGK